MAEEEEEEEEEEKNGVETGIHTFQTEDSVRRGRRCKNSYDVAGMDVAGMDPAEAQKSWSDDERVTGT
ncbi:hypothetical protein E4U42_005381, partial [Claviceps africana]